MYISTEADWNTQDVNNVTVSGNAFLEGGSNQGAVFLYLQDEPFWQACSARAALWMEERFDLVKQTQELEQIYSSLLK
jgi:hypothetical protein